MREIYKLFGTITAAAADGLASFDIVRPGHIVGLWGSVDPGPIQVNAEGYMMEISFASSNGFTTNDTKSSLYYWRQQLAFATSGNTRCADQIQVPGMKIAVQVGERIYMHVGLIGTPVTAFVGVVYLAVESGMGGGSRQRRVRQ